MDRIIIRESDNTSNESGTLGTNVVYVPGFALSGTQRPRFPRLCTSISDFENAFGSEAPTFLIDQLYPQANVGTPGFDGYSIPNNSRSGGVPTWFNKGSVDPSYVYAKELIRAGLPVVYERVNNYTDLPTFAAKLNLYSSLSLYNEGDYVIEDDHYFKCTAAITMPEEFTPAHWTLQSSDGKDVKDFDPTATYEVGDYCIYNSAFYSCVMAVLVAGEWNAANWAEIDDPTIMKYDVSVERMYSIMTGVGLEEEETSIYDAVTPGSLSEVATYNVKYITSGGYPTFGYFYPSSSASTSNDANLPQVLATLAATRGDAIALIDHTDNASRPLTGATSIFGLLNKYLYTNDIVGTAVVDRATVGEDPVVENYRLSTETSTFATLLTPYGTYTTGSTTISLPGSFGYLSALARSLRTYSSWLAIAGITRGYVPSLASLNTDRPLTNAIADSYQSDPATTTDTISINAITYINDQGYTIWGNRTLSSFKNKFATTFLNLRSLVCDVKKTAFAAAQRYMFEQNNDVLWINFKNEVEELLDSMVNSRVISNYKLLKITSTDKTKMAARIQIQPVYAVESFEIEIILTDEELTIA